MRAPIIAGVVLLCCFPCRAATAPRWEANVEKQYGLERFDREPRSMWMKQQGVIFLSSGALLLYQVNPASEQVKLAPRGASGGAGNLVLNIKLLSAEDGRVLNSLALVTNGATSRVLATGSGGFVVQAGAAVYAYSPALEQTAFRNLAFEKTAQVEDWQIDVSPSGEKLVLLHEQVFMPAELLADNTIIHDGRAKVDVDIVNAVTLQTQATFNLEHSLAFWAPSESFLFTSNPQHSFSDGRLGVLDFRGGWSAIRSDLPKEQHFCRFATRAIDAERVVFFGCDAFNVFSAAGKEMYSATGPGCFFSSGVANSPYLALQCDHYSSQRLTPNSVLMSATRPDRIEVYDLDAHAHRLSAPVRSERVSFAISAAGDLAVVDGTNLRVFRVSPERVTK